MKDFSVAEFKPTLFFLLKFVGMYIVANLLYGWFITHYNPSADPATRSIAVQTSALLDVCGWDTRTFDNRSKPTTEIVNGNESILSIYEGCNGINVMIIFVAFLFAFGPLNKNLAWFLPLGLVIIHLINLLRVGLLFWVSLYRPDAMYFVHKYFFTAILYVVVFILWMVWVKKFSTTKTVAS